MNIKKYMNLIIVYFRSHMWCSFAAAITIAVVLVVGVMQFYLKNEYMKYLLDSTHNTEQAILSSVDLNIKNHLDNLIQIGTEIAVNDKNFSMIEQYVTQADAKAFNTREIKNTLESYARYSQYILAIAVISKDGLIYQYDRNAQFKFHAENIWNGENNEQLIEAFYKVENLSRNTLLPRYTVMTLPNTHPDVSSVDFFHITYPIIGKHFYQDIEYALVITYNREFISKSLGQLSQNSNSATQGYISDTEGNIIYHSNEKYIGFNQQTYITENKLSNQSTSIGTFGWNLNGAIDEEALNAEVNEIYTKALGLYVLIVIFILLLLFWATQRILKPVDTIYHSIHNVKKGNMQERIQVKGTHEIWQLANEYNGMMHAIRKMNRQVKEQHEEMLQFLKMKQRAERETLESQINAHFICNTLNAINYEVMESGNYKVSILLKKLSNILRYTFDQKNQNVYMFQEITWIEQYLFLQKERLENVFDYKIEFEPEFEGWPCRKLMLQPFVENSILHGFEGKESGGMIHIIGEGEGQCLKLTIEDNGNGMTKEREEDIRAILINPVLAKEKEVGIGISNVIIRMRMYYGDKLKISMETKWEMGTRFVFIIPKPEDK